MGFVGEFENKYQPQGELTSHILLNITKIAIRGSFLTRLLLFCTQIYARIFGEEG